MLLLKRATDAAMDVYGQVRDDFGTSFHFPTPEIVRPDHSPDPAVAGSCLLYYPTANARKQDKEGIPKVRKSPLRRRTEPPLEGRSETLTLLSLQVQIIHWGDSSDVGS